MSKLAKRFFSQSWLLMCLKFVNVFNAHSIIYFLFILVYIICFLRDSINIKDIFKNLQALSADY